VVAALYRRYRPETFAELIGQSQVTDPLRTALRTDRVNHAYLFSGPRGCGKTTSARILARCLNCAEGPTDTPCGVCPSCVELSREGSGSLDVVEIDAASHNGVDDARDLRERAVFAPARDRFKIFILDEAHMVTSQGFNALLKIVEEPPEHVKFIFATTEPEKVLGTIRSRTHHYPFRLVPPAQMLDYVQQLCESEGVKVDAGVLPLVVRAGGGSVRDTLSLLDQLIAGSEAAADDSVTVEYERAVALLGYTHGALLDEVIDAIGSRDAGAVFAGVDRVIQTGQDPRRFVEDLLERLRDLIIVAATSGNAHAVLRGIPQDQLDTMSAQATMFGTTELSRAADVVNSALSEMTGATSPRLHLELMVARILVPASDDTERGALARVERLERRIGVEGDSGPRASRVEPTSLVEPVETPTLAKPASPVEPRASLVEPVETAPRSNPEPPALKVEPTSLVEPVETPAPAEPTQPSSSAPSAPSTVTLQLVRDSWPEILEVIEKAKRTAWMVVVTAKPIEWREGNVLVLSFPSQNDVAALKQQSTPGDGVGDHLKKAMLQVLGIEPLLIARVAESPAGADRPAPASPSPAAAPAPAVDAAGWAVAAIPESSDPEPEPDSSAQPSAPTSSAQTTSSSARTTSLVEPVETPAPPPSAPTPRTQSSSGSRRYGESVVREILGASFIEEETLKPRVIPQPRDE
jgi:DNA polymerase-3 subunit gamma/tau